jgi:hypothetical protein
VSVRDVRSFDDHTRSHKAHPATSRSAGDAWFNQVTWRNWTMTPPLPAPILPARCDRVDPFTSPSTDC